MEIFNTGHFVLFTLILMRMSGFIIFNPIFGRKNIPIYIRAGMIIVLSLSVYSFSKAEIPDIANTLVYGVLLLKEFAVGYVLGFIIQLFDFIVTFAGGIMDFEMGLSMSSIYDPQNNTQIPLSGQIFSIYYVLLFFAVDGHLALMQILLTSADVVPFAKISITSETFQAVIAIFYQCVVLGVKFAFPLLAIEFLTEMGVGILMKIIPQINVFVVNIQAKILIGVLMLIFLFSPMTDFLKNLVPQMMDSIQKVLVTFS